MVKKQNKHLDFLVTIFIVVSFLCLTSFINLLTTANLAHNWPNLKKNLKTST